MRRLVIALTALLALSLAAAQTQLNIALQAEAGTLDPRIALSVYDNQLIDTMMEPLVMFGYDLALEPRLATSWTVSDDGLTYTFELREGVLFHDGTTFGSEDVKATFDWMLDRNNPATYIDLYADIVEVTAVDERTVSFTLGEQNAFFLNSIARLQIIPSERVDDPSFATNPVGTGPFRFVERVSDDRTVVEAFDDYWGGRAKVDRVVFRPITEDATRLLALEAGEIDLFQGQINGIDLARLEQDDRFVVSRTAGTGNIYLGFQHASEGLKDVRVRQAFAHLLNREAIVDRVLLGVGLPGVSMISPNTEWFNENVQRFPYDPERARELLAEAGYAPGELSLRLYTDENPVRAQIAEIVQFEATQIGVNVDVTVEEFGAFWDRIIQTDDFDLYLAGWTGNVDPNYAMYNLYKSDGANNFNNYSNPRVDELLVKGLRVEPFSDEQFAIYDEAQELIVADLPGSYIYYIEETGVFRANVEGWRTHPYASSTFKNLHLVEKK